MNIRSSALPDRPVDACLVRLTSLYSSFLATRPAAHASSQHQATQANPTSLWLSAASIVKTDSCQPRFEWAPGRPRDPGQPHFPQLRATSIPETDSGLVESQV